MDKFESANTEDVKKRIKEHGLNGIEQFFRDKLDYWKDVEINIGVTGDPGVGKSSFINVIRGLKKYDEGAAAIGVTETTKQPKQYPHPTSDKIKFWDLPGVGTPNNLAETYCKQVGLKKYDTFLILAATRFSENDLKLARMVKSIKKSFFFVRTKIDIDVWNESQDREIKELNEEQEKELLEKIKEDCLKNLIELGSTEKEIFLISIRNTVKWDFARLTKAILDVLPMPQRESLILSLNLLTICSKDMFTEKVQILRGRIWKVAAASGVGALIPVPGLSVPLDVTLLKKEVNFYKEQLGLPDENSYEFRRLTPEVQERIRRFCLTSAVQVGNLIAAYTASSTVEEFTRFVPFIGSVIAASISFTSTYYFLRGCLNEIEETALVFLEELNLKLAEDLPLD